MAQHIIGIQAVGIDDILRRRDEVEFPESGEIPSYILQNLERPARLAELVRVLDHLHRGRGTAVWEEGGRRVDG